jgi:hypothetical protein
MLLCSAPNWGFNFLETNPDSGVSFLFNTLCSARKWGFNLLETNPDPYMCCCVMHLCSSLNWGFNLLEMNPGFACVTVMCFLRSGEKMNFPGRIAIPELPLIDWSKYGRHRADTIQRRLAGMRRKVPLPATPPSGGSFDSVTSGGDGSLSASGGGSCGGNEGASGLQLVRGRLYSESKPQVSERLTPYFLLLQVIL